ncbi:hypothetical protein BDV93DRAFT_566286 [Ceratobasidium sp. AG-I]|nr:hypothetical protein BDV93DRAFT_566286 [Ceratobasidium sp. AG-I]
MNASLSLDSFISSVNTSAYSFGSYIQSHQTRFGRLPEEEDLNDRFSSEYVLAVQKRCSTYAPIGSIISETASNPVKHAIETIVQLWAQFEEDRVWHLIYPNQRSERHLGWDFAWIIRLPDGSKRLTFIQAKNVAHISKGSEARISFDYRERLALTSRSFLLNISRADDNLQSNIFSLWLRYTVNTFKSNIQVNGLYLLYGAPESPVSWVTWKEVSGLQRTHKKTDLVTQAVVRPVQKRKAARLTEGKLSEFMVASDFKDVGDKRAAHEITEDLEKSEGS